MNAKLQFIASKLSCTRVDVWACEMMEKLVHRNLHDERTKDYLFAAYSNPYQEYPKLLNQLYAEAVRANTQTSNIDR